MAHEKMFGICENKCFVELNALNLDLYKVGYFTGNGSETRTITLDFEPRAIVVFGQNYPPTHWSESEQYNFVSFGMAFNTNCTSDWPSSVAYGTAGVSLSGNELTVEQGEQSNGYKTWSLLNHYGRTMCYLAFK